MSLKEMCKSLSLAYVAEIYELIPTESPEKFLTELFTMEMRLPEEAKAQRLIKKAKFINNKSLADYQWGNQIYFPKHLDKGELTSLVFTSIHRTSF
ncbi:MULTISPECIES: hypothetical protein [unclassified Exiguobacterium]|uniref:hypothetical protein n=1 Tax=unclassified Exiguobacterium TaxID=2644629 RepID=UPI003336AE9C